MVSPVKRLKSVNGYKEGDFVLLKRKNTFDVEPSTIGRVGAAGFFARGSMAAYYWHEENRTWKRFAEEKKENHK